MSKSPIVFFVFKRPLTTKKFLELIKESGAKKIYIFADYGRDAKEQKLTDKVKAIIQGFRVSNPTLEIIPHYASHNLGLKKSIISGLSTVFKREEQAIILEDDCLPHPDFFKFTNAMLNKYKDDQRVMSVTGTSVATNITTSYDFTKYQQCWGWATWKRAWQKYDGGMKQLNSPDWGEIQQKNWSSLLARWYWQSILQLVKYGQIKTWDFQWSFAHFMHGGLSIMPSVNLIENIGFDQHATNTKIKSKAANMPSSALSIPLVHPQRVQENIRLSKQIESKFYLTPIAILGMIRQYINFWIKQYAPWH